MGKIALSIAVTCISAPAFSQEEGGVPVYPGGTTPTQTAPNPRYDYPYNGFGTAPSQIGIGVALILGSCRCTPPLC